MFYNYLYYSSFFLGLFGFFIKSDLLILGEKNCY